MTKAELIREINSLGGEVSSSLLKAELEEIYDRFLKASMTPEPKPKKSKPKPRPAPEPEVIHDIVVEEPKEEPPAEVPVKRELTYKEKIDAIVADYKSKLKRK